MTRVRAAVRTWPGSAGGSHLALAVLVFACTFLAVAGPRESLAFHTRALQHTVAGIPRADQSVTATADWNGFTSALSGNNQGQNITGDQIDDVTGELASDFTADGLPLSPARDDWGSLTTKLATLPDEPFGPGASTTPELELIYRTPLSRYVSLAAGRYPSGVATGAGSTSEGTLQVAVTGQTAARLGVHPGSRLVVASPGLPLTVIVTGILRERQPGSTFWSADPVAGQPSLATPPNRPSFWATGAFVSGGTIGALQSAFGSLGMQLEWAFPLTLAGLTANQAQPLAAELSRAGTQYPRLGGEFAASGSALSVSGGPLAQLSAFTGTSAQVDSVLSLLFTGLGATGAVVIALAAWMLSERRAGELGVLRARGAAVWQLSAITLRGAAAASVPAALAGAALAVLVIPGQAAPAGWWLGGLALVTAIAGPALATAWHHRGTRHAGRAGPADRDSDAGVGRWARKAHTAGRGGRGYQARRVVAEVTLCAAAIGGLIVLRSQGGAATGSAAGTGAAAGTGGSGAGGLDLYTSLAPVLVAIPAVLVMMRLYPLAVRGLLRLSARRAGPTGFLALARAARGQTASVLPLFALVMALALAAFAGMVRDAVTRGEVAASWQTTGADAVVNAEHVTTPLTPAAEKAVAAVPGVRRAAAMQVTNWTLPDSTQISAVGVDPASYASLVAGTPSPPIRAGQAAVLAERTAPGQPVPVLASPSVAGSVGVGGETEIDADPGPGTLEVRVAGVVASTPALPGNRAFVLMPLDGIRSARATIAVPAAPNLMLLGGGGIDGAALTATVRRAVPGAAVTLRSNVLAGLAGAPLQHGAYVLVAAALGTAAAFALAALLADLALGAAERRQTLTRLAAMGFDTGQARRLVLLEKTPALLAAAITGTVCALVLPPLTASSLNLSAFTGTAAEVPVRADPVALGLPVAGLILLALAAALLATRVWRGYGVSGALRTDG